MENKKHFSLCALIGKIVLKIAFVVLLIAAAQKVLSKFFHKTLSVSVELNDEKAPEAVDGDNEDSEESEDDGTTEESEEAETEETEEEN